MGKFQNIYENSRLDIVRKQKLAIHSLCVLCDQTFPFNNNDKRL